MTQNQRRESKSEVGLQQDGLWRRERWLSVRRDVDNRRASSTSALRQLTKPGSQGLIHYRFDVPTYSQPAERTICLPSLMFEIPYVHPSTSFRVAAQCDRLESATLLNRSKNLSAHILQSQQSFDINSYYILWKHHAAVIRRSTCGSKSLSSGKRVSPPWWVCGIEDDVIHISFTEATALVTRLGLFTNLELLFLPGKRVRTPYERCYT